MRGHYLGHGRGKTAADDAAGIERQDRRVSRAQTIGLTVSLCRECKTIEQAGVSRRYKDMAFVSITRLRIRSLRFIPQFIIHALRTLSQVKRAGGYVDGALLADRKLTFWTVTLWQEQSDMRRYMTSGAHLKAMPKLLHWCNEASVVHWTQDHAVVPTWQEADRRMKAEGRPSKVRNPSPRHSALAYVPPRVAGVVPIKRPKVNVGQV